MEAVRLRIKDIDFARNEITVRDGKGEKDRLTMLSEALSPALRVQIDAVKRLHDEELKRGGGEVYLPYALDRKYKNAAKEFLWPRSQARLRRRTPIGFRVLFLEQ